jgi:hypothetical protein
MCNKFTKKLKSRIFRSYPFKVFPAQEAKFSWNFQKCVNRVSPYLVTEQGLTYFNIKRPNLNYQCHKYRNGKPLKEVTTTVKHSYINFPVEFLSTLKVALASLTVVEKLGF